MLIPKILLLMGFLSGLQLTALEARKKIRATPESIGRTLLNEFSDTSDEPALCIQLPCTPSFTHFNFNQEEMVPGSTCKITEHSERFVPCSFFEDIIDVISDEALSMYPFLSYPPQQLLWDQRLFLKQNALQTPHNFIEHSLTFANFFKEFYSIPDSQERVGEKWFQCWSTVALREDLPSGEDVKKRVHE